MRIKCPILLIIIYFCFSCSNKPIVITEDELAKDIFYLQNEIKPYSGTCHILYHNSKALKEKLSYKKGILHGPRVTFYKDGKIMREGHYKNGKYNGIWKKYDESGNQVFKIEYCNDTLINDVVWQDKTAFIKAKGDQNNQGDFSNPELNKKRTLGLNEVPLYCSTIKMKSTK